MPLHIAIMIVTIVGMILAYKIIRLILVPEDERGHHRHTERKKRHRHQAEPEPQVDDATLGRLLERAEDLNRRVSVLEEIVAAEKEAEHTQ